MWPRRRLMGKNPWQRSHSIQLIGIFLRIAFGGDDQQQAAHDAEKRVCCQAYMRTEGETEGYRTHESADEK
ncbi:hypothetical protein CE91St33_28250 [Eggerthella lenta]|jgi:hypothetical protein|nr:hypothetical protein [Clostridioides difficile]BDF42763.1 hypothetical protein CE91St33_28250 [Eggerthella lenta]GKG84850.1 hypothetical protein CE91St34_21110 [Eggerthella lenta]GKG88839.1 hypothetical protein CE91St35_29930 [Eggerthella lenta]